MAYVITSLCVGAKRKECLPGCPVESIYEGERQLYIRPDTCIDCGACQQACPIGAVFLDQEVPEKHRSSIQENADFFRLGLPGSMEPARP